jgi:hypothetical protein
MSVQIDTSSMTLKQIDERLFPLCEEIDNLLKSLYYCDELRIHLRNGTKWRKNAFGRNPIQDCFKALKLNKNKVEESIEKVTAHAEKLNEQVAKIHAERKIYSDALHELCRRCHISKEMLQQIRGRNYE